MGGRASAPAAACRGPRARTLSGGEGGAPGGRPGDRQRARSLSSVPDLQQHQQPAGAEDEGSSDAEEAQPQPLQLPMAAFHPGRVYAAHSLPSHIWQGLKCPVCNKFVLPDDIECHLMICLTKPRLSYNEDILSDSKGECVICLEELIAGDIIARLPCLCIYHKGCIDQWFAVNRSCPEHPGD